ncbi:potassium channel family protein [Mariniluteicoccus endophyticus]
MTQQQWRDRTQWPLLGAAVAFVLAYTFQVIANLQGPARTATQAVLAVTWLVFAIDYAVNLRLAPNRLKWFLKHLHELAFVLLPALRPLQLLRLVSLITVFQRAAGRALRGRFLVTAILTAATICYIGALSALDLERNAPEATLTTFPEALWWALTTLIGVGELRTVTWPGRAVAVGLMITGMALLGAITASLASWLVDETDDEDDEERERITREKVSDLHDEVRELRALVEQMHRQRR